MEFNQTILTQNGRTLMAKAVSGQATIKFTKMRTSSSQYQLSQLEMLTNLSNVKQTSDVETFKSNGVTAKVLAAFDNYNLTTGYDVRAVGLYALDPDVGEILYAVSTASVSGYMPPNNGTSATGLNITIYTEVGNADNVNMVVDSAGFATKAELRAIELNVAYSNSQDGIVDFTRTKPNENLVDTATSVVGHIDSQGLLNTTSPNYQQYRTSVFNPVAGNTDYNIYFENDIKEQIEGAHWVGFCLYDEDKVFIKYATLYWNAEYSGLTKTNHNFKTPDNARYIRLSWRSDYRYKIKLEKSDSYTTYLPSKLDNYRDSFMKYIGYSVKNSDKPADYKWQINQDWQRAQVVGINLIKNTSNQLRRADEIYWKVLCSERNTNDFNVADHLGKSITVRVWLEKPTADSKLQCFFKNMGSASGNIIKAGQSGYSQLTINVPNTLPSEWNIVLGNANGTHCDYKDLKIEYGDFASEWTSAPGDMILNSNPINSILATLSAENPSTKLGGTWTQLGTEQKFSQTIYYWQRTQ